MNLSPRTVSVTFDRKGQAAIKLSAYTEKAGLHGGVGGVVLQALMNLLEHLK